MDGKIQRLTICGYGCSLYLPKEYGAPGARFPVVYLNGGDDIDELISPIEGRFNSDCRAFMLLSIQPADWNRDFTPWPAPALAKGKEPFGGGAPAYMRRLESGVKPFMDTHYKTKPEPLSTALMGYSLGGLVSLYALYNSGAFGRIGSLSGSLWYDGWIDYMNTRLPVNTSASVYLSLGSSEEHSRNKRMAAVGDCTRKASGILAGQLTSPENLTLEWNRGGHFADIPLRFAQALLWLMREDKQGRGQ